MKRSRISITSFLTREAWRESTALATGMVALTAALGQLIVTDASANPDGGSVVAGEVEIDTTGPGELTIDQSSSRAVIEWNSFSIDEGEHTRFVQPDADAVALNRVTGSRLSEIAGKLSANGKIILVNPNGVIFTGTAEVNVGSLIASTSDVENGDIMDETNSIFVFDDGPLDGLVINDGDVTVAEGGLAAFVAPYVRNNGKIMARLGRVALGSGNIFTLDLNGDGLTQLALSDDVINVSREGRKGAVDVTGDGLIEADGGLIVLSVSDASALIDETINMDGVIRARSVEASEGRIVLGGPEARTIVRGELDATGHESGTIGGEIDLTGKRVFLTDTSLLDASAPLAGGSIHIGQPTNVPIPAFRPTSVILAEKGTVIRADAGDNGDGGEIIASAESDIRFHGQASARAGAESGNGGAISLASGNRLGITQASFDASAPFGEAGELQLEGSSVIVGGVEIDAIEEDLKFTSEFVDAEDPLAAELEFLADGLILSLDTVERTLNDGTNVMIAARDTDVNDDIDSGDILIANSIDVDSDREVRLVLDADRDVHISGDIASTDEPLQMDVSAGRDISFERSPSNNIFQRLLAVLTRGEPSSGFVVTTTIGSIKTGGDVTLNAGGAVLKALESDESATAEASEEGPGPTQIEASTINITANGGIDIRTASADLTLTNQGDGSTSIENVGDATLDLTSGDGSSVDVTNTGNLTLVAFDAKGGFVDISATGNIEAQTPIGTEDAPVSGLRLAANGNLKLVGATSSDDQVLIGRRVTLAGSYRTGGGLFQIGDDEIAFEQSQDIERNSTVIDGNGGPVVIDTTLAASDVDESSVSRSSGTINFIGPLDGTNAGADALTLRVGDGAVRFNGDVGGNVPLGVVRIEGDTNAAAVDVANVTTDEDISVALDIGAPETSFQSFTLSNLPVGSTLEDGSGRRENIETADQTVDLTEFDLDSLRLTPPENSDDDANVSVTLAIPSNDRIVRSESNLFRVAELIDGTRAESSFTVTVNPVVDGTDIQPTESDWLENRLPVEIDATLRDTDGSESAIIRIDDLPEGTTLSAGTPNADGSFSLTLAELTNLELISANDGDLASALTVSTTTTEANDPAQPLVSASITLAIPERPVPPSPPIGPLPTVSLADTRILEGAGQHGPIGDAVRPNRLPDASPIVLASSREDAPQDLEEPIDPFSVEPAAGEDSARPEVWEACPDIVDASVSWQNTASDAAFNVNPNIVPYSVDVYCGGYQMTAAGRGVSEDYQDLSFVSRDFWTDLKQERTPSVIEELRSTPSTYSVR